MKYFLLISFAFFALVQSQTDWTNVLPPEINPLELDDDTRIVGGNEATPNSYPYQAALFLTIKGKSRFCGGSIISENIILTAAHCVYQATEVEVLVGAHKIHEKEPAQQRHKSTEFIVHRGWNPLFLTADIAVVKLPTNITFTDEIKPIQLPRYSEIEKDLTRMPAVVSGWGKDKDGSTVLSPVLRFVQTKIISILKCKLFYFFYPGNNHVCTSGSGGVGACSGDSGGPLVTYEDGVPVQQGLVSFGMAFGCEIGFPSAYTRVSAFLKWIHTNTGIYIRD